jgi:hypothetical protein
VASERVEVVESTVVAWAGTVAATVTVTVARSEVASGQSPGSQEGTGTAWLGASVGEARAARVARVEAVAVGSATRMRAAKELAGTKGL